MANNGVYFLAGASSALVALAATVIERDRRRDAQQAKEQSLPQLRPEPMPEAPLSPLLVEPQALDSISPVERLPEAASTPLLVEPQEMDLFPRAELLVSAGPRKSTRETELGEDIAGTVVSTRHIVFWVLDGTSDTVVIPGEHGRDLFSSRLFCLAISAALHQLAYSTTDAYTLALAAMEEAAAQMQGHIAQHQVAFQRFGETEPAQVAHWDVSTTMLLGILASNGEVDLFRIGDSKVLCFDEDKQMVATPIDHKPASIELGRIHARLVRGDTYTLELFAPDRSEQLHSHRASRVRRVLAFSDGIGPSTEQYLRRMLGQRTYAQFHDELARTPNKTFDDKTLVLASFEPMP